MILAFLRAIGIDRPMVCLLIGRRLTIITIAVLYPALFREGLFLTEIGTLC
jgi:hypothetical protein